MEKRIEDAMQIIVREMNKQYPTGVNIKTQIEKGIITEIRIIKLPLDKKE